MADMAQMGASISVATAEQALRDLLTAAMFKEHGANWMDKVVAPEVRAEWRKIREQEQKQRPGHALAGLSDLSYSYLGDLVSIIRKKGNWSRIFEPVLGPKDEAFALFNILETVRKAVTHNRRLLPFEEDLASGIAGRIRNRVTIYLSNQDPDGDYYPRIDRIEDNFGNLFTYSSGFDFSNAVSVQTQITLRVGDTVTFRCEGTDPQGRILTWHLRRFGSGSEEIKAEGQRVELAWRVQPQDCGSQRIAHIRLTHDGPYHRNVGGFALADAIVMFYYRVLPPS
jgi:hypothetical protein